MSLQYLHQNGWLEVNSREHEIAVGSRTFANRNFSDEPGRRQDFIDGATFGLLALIHAADVDILNQLFTDESNEQRNTETAAIYPAQMPDISASDAAA